MGQGEREDMFEPEVVKCDRTNSPLMLQNKKGDEDEEREQN